MMVGLLAPRCRLCGGPGAFLQYCAICSAFVKHIAPTVVWLHEHAGEADHAMAGWFGDPNVPHEPGTEPADVGWRPACSCGFRAPLTHGTEDAALRAAQTHAAVSAPGRYGRYTAELDAGTVHIRCALCPGKPLASFPNGLDGHEVEAIEAARAHDRERHEEGDDD
jgi:hypothetical protein